MLLNMSHTHYTWVTPVCQAYTLFEYEVIHVLITNVHVYRPHCDCEVLSMQGQLYRDCHHPPILIQPWQMLCKIPCQ